jgi:cytochrome c556
MRPLGALLLLLVLTHQVNADDPAAVVKYRQATMKALGAHMSAMSLVVKKQISDRRQLAVHAESVRAISEGLASLFPAGTGPDKVSTATMMAAWRETQAFRASALKLQTEATKLATIAKKGDAKSFDAEFAQVSAACNECHKKFRTRDSD